jgi:hypothetical protein
MPNTTLPPQQPTTEELGSDLVFNFTMPVKPSGGISGWTMLYEFLNKDGSVAFSKTTGAGITIVDGTLCTFTVARARADTVNLLAGDYKARLHRTDAGHYGPMARFLHTLTAP